MPKGKLVLKDGHEFPGEIFGAEKPSTGEIVFSTGMVGYPESLTDPSFHGQILTYTFPLIGNYGIPDEEKEHELSKVFESEKIHISGLVCSEYSQEHSHWRSHQSLSQKLKEAGIPGISGIDTRALTKILRTKGCMPAKIVPEKLDTGFTDTAAKNLVADVSPNSISYYSAQISSTKKQNKTIVVIDCGVKNNTLHNFLNRGVNLIRIPWNFDFHNPDNLIGTNLKSQKIPVDPKALNILQNKSYDGIFLSNGPGDPALLTPTINIIKKALSTGKPIFGICLGNQLLGIAAGATTYKLKFGHRAQNQPCINTENGKCYMTSQNHGYAIKRESLPKNWKIWFENANDKTIEGIKHQTLPLMAVQFHPEACPGPLDTEFLFDQFISNL